MGIEYESIIDRPRDEVWEWHTRPGAMRRLVPPWQPMTVVQESPSLAEGDAVLGLPGGLRWVARHDPSAYVAGSRFADELASHGPASWPAAGHRRVAAHAHVQRRRRRRPWCTTRSRRRSPPRRCGRRSSTGSASSSTTSPPTATPPTRASTPLVIAMTGASGLVGSALSAFLTTGGHRVIRLVRTAARGDDERLWNPRAPAADLLSGVDAVVHLAGASIAGRFTDRAPNRHPGQPDRADPPAGGGGVVARRTGRARSSARRRSASTGSIAATRS